MKDLISVVIPVYNTGESLRASLESVLNQTYDNLEIIIVDDCSTDSLTLDILDEFKQKDSRISVTYLSENYGTSYVRNLGIELAKGAYFALLDSDDRFVPDYIERMYQGILDTQVDFVLCNIRNFVIDDSVPLRTAANWNLKPNVKFHTNQFITTPLFVYMPIRVYACLVNTARYRQSDIVFPNEIRFASDQIWANKIFYNLETFSFLNFIGIDRLLRSGSIINSKNTIFYKFDLQVFVMKKDMLKEHGLFELQKDHFIRVALPHVIEALKEVKEPESKADIVKMSNYLLEGAKLQF